MYFDSYIARIRRQTEAWRGQRTAQAAAVVADPRAALRAQVTQWYSALPLEDRAPRYLLEDLVKLFGATPQQLGLALAELGWRRKRVWLNEGPYRRYWYPPPR